MSRANFQKGFTLVELMISMVLGLFIVIALLTMLINVNRNNTEMTKTNRVIENGRFTLHMLQADLSHAGFWGGFVPGFDDLTNAAAPSDVPTGVPDPCLPLASWTPEHRTNLIGIAIQAYAVPAVVPTPTVPVCATGTYEIVRNPQPNTDVLVIRHLEPCAAGVDAGCPAVTADDAYFRMARCTDTDSVNYTTTTYVLGTSATHGLTPLYQRNCATAADAYKVVSNLYYVRSYAVSVGDGIPTLMRSQFNNGEHKAAEAMIEGVERFRVELGIDSVSDSGSPLTSVTFNTSTGLGQAVSWQNPAVLTSPTNRGDGIPDAYVRCGTTGCSADQLMHATAAKVYVLLRSETASAGYTDSKRYCMASICASDADRVGPFTDGYKRHQFTQAVRLVNISARRETP